MASSKKLRKAAAVLDQLPADQVQVLLQRLGAEEREKLPAYCKNTSTSGAPDLAEQLEALESFVADALADEGDPHSALSPTPGRYSDQLDEHADRQSQFAGSEDNQPAFGFLKYVPSEQIASLLEPEHPQTIAMVLSFLPSATGTEVLRFLDPAQRVSVIRRLTECDQPGVNVVAALERVFRNRLLRMQQVGSSPASRGRAAALRLLALSDRQTRGDVLAYLAKADPALAESLRGGAIEFEDLAHMDDRHIRRLLDHVDTSLWAPALRSASPKMRRRILDNVAPSVARLLRGQIDGTADDDHQRGSAAQLRILETAFRLAEAGKLQLPSRG